MTVVICSVCTLKFVVILNDGRKMEVVSPIAHWFSFITGITGCGSPVCTNVTRRVARLFQR